MPNSRVSRVVSVAVLHDDRVLVLERSPQDSFPGYWELPGGSVEGRESFLDAATRELAEETGIGKVLLEEFYRAVRPPLLPRSVKYDLVDEAAFRGRVSARPDVRLNAHEHAEYRWASEAELGVFKMAEPKRVLARLALRLPSDP